MLGKCLLETIWKKFLLIKVTEFSAHLGLTYGITTNISSEPGRYFSHIFLGTLILYGVLQVKSMNSGVT